MRASLSAAVMPCAMSTYEMNGRKVGFLWHRHFSSMTIDQNEQTLSGVTDPLFVVRLDLAGGGPEPKARCPSLTIAIASAVATTAAISLAQWPTTDCLAKHGPQNRGNSSRSEHIR